MENQENSNQNTEGLQLGGNIQLTGFKEVDQGSMVIVKKLVGTYARKFQDHFENLQELALRLKPIHKTEENQIHNLHGRLTLNGKTHAAETEDRNLFFAIDSVLKKLENEVRN